jgi:predicted dehydrogenase
MPSSSSELWLIGSGLMAQHYAAVLHALDYPFRVIGRGAHSAAAFEQATGVPVFTGGLDSALSEMPAPDQAIVAVGVELLASVAQRLISAGCRRVLLEKPGGLCLAELDDLQTIASRRSAKVWIAYNRRFHASVEALHQRVIAEGGISSAMFEFTEWSHIIEPSQVSAAVLNRWLLANSSHVLDLAFYLIGLPADGQWLACHAGQLHWHSASARFHGAGFSDRGIPFAYISDWQAPGRWGVEVMTRSSRYLLRPLECLQVIHLGSVNPQPVPIDDELDLKFKPGVYRQCQAFLSNQTHHLCSLSEQRRAFSIYGRIAGYSL